MSGYSRIYEISNQALQSKIDNVTALIRINEIAFIHKVGLKHQLREED